MKKFLLGLIFSCGAGIAVVAEEAMPPAVYYDSNAIGKDLGVSLSQRPNFGVGRINSGGDTNQQICCT